jgi:hypothetical protein
MTSKRALDKPRVFVTDRNSEQRHAREVKTHLLSWPSNTSPDKGKRAQVSALKETRENV